METSVTTKLYIGDNMHTAYIQFGWRDSLNCAYNKMKAQTQEEILVRHVYVVIKQHFN